MKRVIKHILYVGLLVILVMLSAESVYASKSYGQPSLTKPTHKPEILGNQGGIVSYGPWKLTVSPGTFTYDIYFRKGCWDKTFPMSIGRYWQVSDICEFWPKSQFNNAAAEIKKVWTVTYTYSENELIVLPGISLPESSLKIVFSDDLGSSWIMLKSSVVDTENNTVAAVTDRPGGFMVMSGFVSPLTYYNYTSDVKGVYTYRNGVVAPDVVTLEQKIRGGVEWFLMRVGYSLGFIQ